ncbi:RagB/SusD family nutrient uptake outer membrane protein [Sphingobacterium griseoflavum]|uniref:Carbohydrate-binding protein n=1 Tax=Sphingobacterium griseoflavum TaxID=1474952 RepID=A0ABQ3HXB1_9SPHI|nr:RagB/SusD family nutrient uptake outer membrane protein [Sphingobacterium griseoflavum]GHE35263.1 carbohydrate-binding protein [Sphingobacterium griseoflavum]
MKINMLMIGICALALASCEKWLEPDPENIRNAEQMFIDTHFAQGFVTTAYRTIPSYYNQSDFATDDAVTNQRSNAFLQMATGSWSAANNPLSVWNQAYASLLYLHQFLENSQGIKWSEDEEANALFNIRLRGEAYGLRALYYYYLLRNHGGPTSNGQLMGVPIVTEFLPTTADFNMPRDNFAACLQQIYLDLDSAEHFLPIEYSDVAHASQIPERFAGITQNASTYNRVMGRYSRQLFNGLIAKSFRARAALLAASPAFQHASNPATWEDAANAAADIIQYKGGTNALPANGLTFYNNINEIDGLSDGINPPEIIWRENVQANNGDREAQNYPPSLYGQGLTNPTQNLVDAFPMANGYPIDHPNSTFNENDPYAGRDPRLRHYIIYNGNTAGVNNTPITTGINSTTDDALNRLETSTRTGYYMKKGLRMDVNRTPNNIVGRNRYTPRIRYTELYLSYAEAANEAWGPTGMGSHSFSAYDIVRAIRRRAGVGTTNNDPFLEECRTDKEKMRELIRNERRLELCFESFRFWDLRRWKLTLNETARGIQINGVNYTPIAVEVRSYQPHMYYGPIPFSEILKYSNLVQNTGWE